MAEQEAALPAAGGRAVRATERTNAPTTVVVLLLSGWFLAACGGTLVPIGTPSPIVEPTATATPLVTRTVEARTVPTSPRPSPTTPRPAATPTAASTPTTEPTPTPVPTAGASFSTPPPRPVVPVPSPPATEPVVLPSPAPLPTETMTSPGACDLALDKAVAPVAGTTSVIVTLTVQQRGTMPCPPGALVSDPLPAGFTAASDVRVVETGGSGRWECAGTACRTAAALPPGYRATFTFTVVGEPGSAAENCAVVSVTGDEHAENDSRCVTLGPIPTPPPTPTPVSCLFGLEKTMEAARPGTTGQTLAVTAVIRLQNTGPEQCRTGWSTFVLTDDLPPGMVVQSVRQVTGAGWSCVSSGSAVECSGAPPQPGGHVVVSIELLVEESARRTVNCARVEPLGMRACATLG